MERKVKITGTGSYVPPTIYSNEKIKSICPDTNPEWTYSTLGIKERHITTKECTSDLAVEAARRAMNDSGVYEPDFLMVATATPDRIAPSTACILQHKLGLKCPAFDMNAVCSGFLYGMEIARQFIESGNYKNILVIGADNFSKITDWTRRDCVFFGDGAGATMLSLSPDEGFIHAKLYANGEGANAWTVPAGGSENPTSIDTIKNRLHFYFMNGKMVYNTAISVLPNAIKETLSEAGLGIEQVAHVIPHQPSIGILKETAKRLNIPFGKFHTNMDKYANTSAATIPILLDEVKRGGKIKKGEIVLFAAMGSFLEQAYQVSKKKGI